jgi:tripartite-type tricarboxylate transporter receptor subunit TctC
MFFSGYPAALPLIRSGSIKVLAVSSAQRAAGIPEVATVAELAGIKEFDLTVWQGFFVPRGTPPAIVARLNGEINAVLEQPDIRQKLSEAGAYVRPISTDAFAAFVRAQSEKYKRIAADTGISIE